ncbi:MAG: hypothetical protein NT163_00420 [Chlorobiales bacterium]|nr:hypothetical protein [Chlorobiales bacterium]
MNYAGSLSEGCPFANNSMGSFCKFYYFASDRQALALPDELIGCSPEVPEDMMELSLVLDVALVIEDA